MPEPKPADVQQLLHALLADPGRPRLTWYGAGHERIELSAKTLGNWVSKSANLLVEELDAGPGTRVGISMPPHWRTVVWLLATWSAGAHAVVIPPAGDVDVLITERPDSGVSQVSARAGARLVAVALPGLAMRFDGDLPPGVIDAATEVRAMGDVFVAPFAPDPADLALSSRDQMIPYAGLLPETTLEQGTRLLTAAGPAQAREAYLAPLIRDGSIVLHAGRQADEIERIAAQEETTATFP